MAKTNCSTPTKSKRTECDTLKNTIEVMDALSQDGFRTISELAGMALSLMEYEAGPLSPERTARVLDAIRAKADDIMNLINYEAEVVGCNYKDKAAERRQDARNAAETRLRNLWKDEASHV